MADANLIFASPRRVKRSGMGDVMAVIMLDAGHGGYDNGASYNGRNEKDDTLKLTLAVGSRLENAGVNVLYTRTTDLYQSPTEKAQIANRSDAAYFISIHRNAAVSPNLYAGVQTLVFSDVGIPALFAQNINAALARVGYRNLGVEVRTDLVVLRRTVMPAALVEVGFIDNDRDNALFDTAFGQTAQAIADGILETIDGASVESAEADSYSVELGVFMHHDNADGLAKCLQEDGYSCYVEPVNRCYRVASGSYTAKEDALALQKELFGKGYEARVIER